MVAAQRRVSAASGSTRAPAPSARLAPSAATTAVAATSSPARSVAVERPGTADAHRAAQPQGVQLADDDGRARAADAGALDGERSAVERDAGVAPEPAVMVEHPRRLVEEHARERERLARVVGQQRALGQLGGRVQVRHGRRG